MAALNAENISAEAVRDTLKPALAEIQALDHPLYPVKSLPDYDDVATGLSILEDKLGARRAGRTGF